jgi:ring-1,2-phenylacetyl-CoA epoxidase subunit PaaD
MHAIEQNIAQIMTAADIAFEINTILAPAWTTDWITEQGRKKLLDYGIAPPQKTTASKRSLFATDAHIACPRCASTQTNMLSQFGSTACKALYQCQACHEPFDYFKCL